MRQGLPAETRRGLTPSVAQARVSPLVSGGDRDTQTDREPQASAGAWVADGGARRRHGREKPPVRSRRRDSVVAVPPRGTGEWKPGGLLLWPPPHSWGLVRSRAGPPPRSGAGLVSPAVGPQVPQGHPSFPQEISTIEEGMNRGRAGETGKAATFLKGPRAWGGGAGRSGPVGKASELPSDSWWPRSRGPFLVLRLSPSRPGKAFMEL